MSGAREKISAATYFRLTLVEEFALLMSGHRLLVPHVAERVLTYLALANKGQRVLKITTEQSVSIYKYRK